MDDYKKLRFVAHQKGMNGEFSVPSFGGHELLFFFHDIVLEDILNTGTDQLYAGHHP